MSDSLLFEQHDDGVAVLTFNRPHARNALDLETMRRFADVVPQLVTNRALRALVLTGAGEAAFCSGGDLVELSGYPSAADAEGMIALMGDALLALERLPLPVIAAINGYALGGGSEVAVACDLRIVDEQARMGFVQIRLGLTPGWGGGQRMMRLVGYAKALEILLEGRPLHADELLSLGLANRVVPSGTALQHALDFARQLTQWSPDVVRAVKTLLQAGLNATYDNALQVERSVFPPLWAADAHLDAVQMFLEKGKR
jgi:enoyl-CoA hydratase/carnithine racemase